MNDLERVLSKVKRLRAEKSEAVSASGKLQAQLTEKVAELDGFADVIALVKGMNDTAYKVLPTTMKTAFARYRGKADG
jgi:hypothetical protein